MINDQEMKMATMVCCPMCDEDKCVGRFTCPEIKRYLEKLEGEKDECKM